MSFAKRADRATPSDRYQTVNEMVAEIFSVESLDQSVASFDLASLHLRLWPRPQNRCTAAVERRIRSSATTTALGSGMAAMSARRADANAGHSRRPGGPVRPTAYPRSRHDHGAQRGRWGELRIGFDRSALGQQVNCRPSPRRGHRGEKVIAGSLLRRLRYPSGVSMIGEARRLSRAARRARLSKYCQHRSGRAARVVVELFAAEGVRHLGAPAHHCRRSPRWVWPRERSG